MATANFTYTFATATHPAAWTDVGDDAALDSIWSSTDGNPAGSREWTVSTPTTSSRSERARHAAMTWEALFGIPPGAIVTQIQGLSWDELSWGIHQSTRRVLMRFVDAGGTIVHSAGDLLDSGAGTPTNNTGVAQAKGGGTLRDIDSAYQASNTPVRLEIQLTVTDDGVSPDLEQDNIVIQITYATVQDPIAIQDSVPPASFGPF